MLAATSSDSPFANTFLIFFRLRYSSSHLALYVAMRCSPSDSPNVSSTMGRTWRVPFPALDQLFDDGRLAELLVDELHPHLELFIVLHHRGLGDAHRRVLQQRLHDEREPQLRRPYRLLSRAKLGERGHPDLVVRENLLGERLITGDEQARRRRSGVPIAVHLQHGGERVLVPGVPAERLTPVEHELRLEGGQPVEHRRQLVGDPDHQHVVSLAISARPTSYSASSTFASTSFL